MNYIYNLRALYINPNSMSMWSILEMINWLRLTSLIDIVICGARIKERVKGKGAVKTLEVDTFGAPRLRPKPREPKPPKEGEC